MHGAFDPDAVIVAFPFAAPTEVAGRDMGDAPMLAQLFPVLFGRRAHLGQAAGGQEPAREAAQPAEAARLVVGRVDGADRADIGLRHALVRHVGERHAALGHHSGFQAGGVAQQHAPAAALVAVRQLERLGGCELADIAYAAQQLGAGEGLVPKVDHRFLLVW